MSLITGTAEDVMTPFGNLLKRNRELRERRGRESSPRRREHTHRKRHGESYVPDHTRSDTRPWMKREK
jgi:hypothetical protein